VLLERDKTERQLTESRNKFISRVVAKRRMAVLPALGKQAMSIKDFVANSFLSGVSREVREAALIAFISLATSRSFVLDLKTVPLEVHAFMIKHLEARERDLLDRFSALFRQIIYHFFRWVIPRTVRRPRSIRELIEEVEFFNKMNRHSSIKLKPI
jgi:hypothetical protein